MRKHKTLFFIIAIVAFLLAGYGSYRYAKSFEWKLRNSLCRTIAFSTSEDFSFAIHPFEKDGEYYIVLPAYWNKDSIVARFTGSRFAKLNLFNVDLTSTTQHLSIATDSTYIAEAKLPFGISLHTYKFILYQSKINSIFINTESGNMNAVDWSKDKSGSEKGSMMAVNDSGIVEYLGKLSNIHGRGNMTWNIPKKPYSIKIKDKTSIFGLKKAKKFNLLANACDESELRNWIMMNTAEQLGMSNAIRSAFSVLYLNGNYRGVYQITNKVDIDPSGVNIADLGEETESINKEAGIKIKKLGRFSVDRNDTLGFKKGVEGALNPTDISGGYLLDHNFKIHRYAESPSGFISPYGYPTEIKSPEFATKEQVEYISNYYSEMMEAIRDANGKNPKTGLHYSQYIDVDSYIFYYLCSEVFYNLDAVNASLFMYKDKGSKMFCGPIWDYDISMNTKVYWDKANGFNSFFIREAREKDGSLRIFGQLYNHPEYKNRLVEIYNKRFLPIVREYYQGNCLDSIHDYLKEDISINDIMWGNETKRIYSVFHKYCVWNDNAIEELEEVNQKGDYWNVKNFLEKRCEFFASVWETTNSESQFTKITWDFGQVEQFQHVTTQVSYLVKEQEWTWPRYIISNNKVVLSEIVNASGEPITEGQKSEYYQLKYKEQTVQE